MMSEAGTLAGSAFVAFCVLYNSRLVSPQFLTEVPVIGFSCEDSSYSISGPNITLHWFIQPAGATLFWLRCYHDKTRNGKKHFYTYDQNRVKTSRIGEMGRRTNHTFYEKDQSKVFTLTISPPRVTDAGSYTCELEAPGHPQNRMASLNLREFKLAQTPRLTDLISTAAATVTEKIPVSSRREQSASLGLAMGVSIAVLLLLICGIGGFVLCKRKRKSRRDCEKRGRTHAKIDNLDNLQSNKKSEKGLLPRNDTSG